MDVYYYFNYLSTAWMTLEALPLITSPTIVLALLSPEIRSSTAIEEYLSRSLGFTLIAFGMLNLLLTGSIPLTSMISDAAANPTSTDMTDPTAPYAVPSLTITMTYHCAVAFYCYMQYAAGHSYTFLVAIAVHSFLAAMGGWVMLFGTASGHITRKSGLDKGGKSGMMLGKEAGKALDKKAN